MKLEGGKWEEEENKLNKFLFTDVELEKQRHTEKLLVESKVKFMHKFHQNNVANWGKFQP